MLVLHGKKGFIGLSTVFFLTIHALSVRFRTSKWFFQMTIYIASFSESLDVRTIILQS